MMHYPRLSHDFPYGKSHRTFLYGDLFITRYPCDYLNFLYPLFFKSFTFALRTFAEAPFTLIFFLQPLKAPFATFLSFAFTVRVLSFLQFTNALEGIVLIFLFKVIEAALAPLNVLAPIPVT